MGTRGRRVKPEHVAAALNAIRRIIQVLRASAGEAERQVRLTGAQVFALQQLGGQPGMSVNELAARTFTHQSSVSIVVQRLVKRKLVMKTRARDDRRRLELALTAGGRAMLRRSPKPPQERLIAAVAALPPRDRRMLVRTLNAVAKRMGAGAAPPRMLFEDAPVRRHRRGKPRSQM